MPRNHVIVDAENPHGTLVPFTAEEETARDAEEQAWLDDAPNRKLKNIKKLRLDRLKETDWWASRGNMSVAQSDWRQALRDLPQNNTTEEQYDILLARDGDNNLTHAIWSKP